MATFDPPKVLELLADTELKRAHTRVDASREALAHESAHRRTLEAQINAHTNMTAERDALLAEVKHQDAGRTPDTPMPA